MIKIETVDIFRFVCIIGKVLGYPRGYVDVVKALKPLIDSVAASALFSYK